ncbi:MAG: xanthine dehydrogenase family protein subunit M [Desulfobacteraceae bacterium]|nr:xanthine dehydrogenase family protein subunit M [Desulfobacteraceae bacterium]
MLLPNFNFHDPETLAQALKLKNTYGSEAKILAGGTDLLVHMKKKLISVENIICLSKIKELFDIQLNEESIVIGACVTMAKLSESDIIANKFSALKIGAQSLGNHLIRNRATIGGNACNASPAGDTLPALLIYKAVALIESIDNKREIPIADFFIGPGKPDLGSNEILTGFKLQVPGKNSGAHYIQLGKRKSSEINVVNVASFLQYDPDTENIINARIALGSVAATPIRSYKAEAILKERVAEEALFFEAGETARKEDCKPIDDFRGTAEYRQAMVGVLTKRTLLTAFEQAKCA